MDQGEVAAVVRCFATDGGKLLATFARFAKKFLSRSAA